MVKTRPLRPARTPRKEIVASASYAAGSDQSDENLISLRSLDGFVSFHLRRTRNLLSQRYAAAAVNPDVPLGSLTALAAIVDNPGISQTALGRQLGLNKSTTVVLLDALCNHKWAERRPSLVDRRAHSLFALPLGEEKLKAMLKQLRSVEDAALGTLTRREREQLLELLRKAGHALLPGNGS